MTKPFNLYEAIQLLQADLVWSDDFDSIKDSLAMLLQTIGQNLNAKEINKLEPALGYLIADLTEGN
jgi:hypothetical protein